MLRIMAVVFWLAVIFLTIVFSVPNLHPISVHYYAGSLEMPLAVLLLCSLWIGALLGVIFAYSQLMRLRYENRRLRKLNQMSVPIESVDPAA